MPKMVKDWKIRQKHDRERTCPACGHVSGGVFLSYKEHLALECYVCRFAWAKYKDGSWERIVGQDWETWQVEVDGAMIIKDEEEVWL